MDYYETYCPYGTGGGSPPPTGGGTTSGGPASNKITADAALRTQVNNAITTAQLKMNNCAAALLNLKASGGAATLGQVLAGKANPPAGGWTLQNFMTLGGLTGQNFVMDTDTNTNGYCAAGYPAYTHLYDHTTYVCEREYNAQTSTNTLTDQWAILIHEELHCLGYPENPPDPNAQTPADITKMVEGMCN